MAKRTRYPNRPARRPGSNPAAKPAASKAVGARPASIDESIPDLETFTTRTGSLTDLELARAAALEAEIVAAERAVTSAQAAATRRAQAPRIEGRRAPVDLTVPLSVRASHEYAYVGRDVRRIGLTAAIMFGILAALHVAVNVAGVISL